MSASFRQLSALAWRESRTARRRLLLYMSSISLGVAALVAIDSFAANVTGSVTAQSRTLLGGDVTWSSRQKYPAVIDSLIDSLNRQGTPTARLTTFASMGSVPGKLGTRLVQVRAVSGNYPFYGVVTTEPADRWKELQGGARTLVDPSVLIALDARVGDSLTLGYGRFEIVGVLTSVPGDPGIEAIIGPRVFIPARYIPETQLLGFGSRATYETVFRLPDKVVPAKWLAPFRPRLEAQRVRPRTVDETESDLTNAIERLSDFLGIVGLIALLLGGIGVASGVNAFITRKIDTVAVLRCVGATSRQVLYIYTAQAAVMGVLGAAIGAVLGVAIQFLLPFAIKDFIPVDVTTTLEPRVLAIGLGIGLWVALVFALRPLLGLRHISPLQALRRDVDASVLRMRWRDWPRLLVNVALVGSVVAFALSRAGRSGPRRAIALSAGIAVAMLALWVSATVMSYAARKGLRRRWPYVVRQGVANLYRPANQTKAVVLALGFGAFLISTVYLLQVNQLRQLDASVENSRGNLLFFDVQDDQAKGLDSLFRAMGQTVLQRAPIVTMRIASINGTPNAELAKDTSRQSWTLRREYRSTFRDSLVHSEKIVRGRWFKPPRAGLVPAATDTGEVSLEIDLAKQLSVSLNDIIVWNVQGVPIPTRVTSFREVEWARFEPNFFAVLSPASVAAAPRNWVFLANVQGTNAVARLQRAAVDRFPNVSSIDLTLILQTVGKVVRKVSVAIRFLAVFSLAMGVPVLFSAVAATRRERVREGVLLKTLGATRRQIGRILLAEYALLGLLGSLTGMVLSFGGTWALAHWMFETPYRPAWQAALMIALLMTAVTVTIGLLSGRDVFRETAMEALRQ